MVMETFALGGKAGAFGKTGEGLFGPLEHLTEMGGKLNELLNSGGSAVDGKHGV
jgi:hypothetical protein